MHYIFEENIEHPLRFHLDDLLRGLFQIDPAKRLTAEQVLQHSLFKDVAQNLNFNEILDLNQLINNGVIVKIYSCDERKGLIYTESRPAGKIYRPYKGKWVQEDDPR